MCHGAGLAIHAVSFLFSEFRVLLSLVRLFVCHRLAFGNAECLFYLEIVAGDVGFFLQRQVVRHFGYHFVDAPGQCVHGFFCSRMRFSNVGVFV